MIEDVALHDPDDWINYWLSLHPSELFYGELAQFALACLHGPSSEDGPGTGTLRFTEGDQLFEVEVEYVLEQFPNGRVLHVLSIRCEGDPLPPATDQVSS